MSTETKVSAGAMRAAEAITKIPLPTLDWRIKIQNIIERETHCGEMLEFVRNCELYATEPIRTTARELLQRIERGE